ncbi:hypothetical protein LPJ53_002093 [Coemansia erecta]|uniref:P-loop containing nucleoside triphosphate hydrolase protein n=1 Tax=Coemansia erecta TaxID=147472 RepID=A0A9W7Y4Z4_9FUNG|nr:hypothetical protein LPJ53_002093 [Coemansia erecta]
MLIRLKFLKSKPELPSSVVLGALYIAKIAIVALALVASLSEHVFYFGLMPKFNVISMALVVQTVAIAASIYLHYREQFTSRVGSTILLLFWPSTFLVTATRLRTTVSMGVHHHYVTSVFATGAFMLLSVTAMFVEMQPKPPALYEPLEDDTDSESIYLHYQSLEERANIISRFTYGWMTPFLNLGTHKPIEFDDIPQLKSKNLPRAIAKVFQRNWRDEMDSSQPSLIRAVFRTYWPEIAVRWSMIFVYSMSAFAHPILLSRLIGFMTAYNGPDAEPVENGYFYAISMYLVALFRSFILQQYVTVGYNTQFRVKTSFMTAIYRKTLVLSTDSRKEYSMGEIVSHMSTDSSRVGNFIGGALYEVWSLPLRIIVALYMLYNTIGWSVFVGVGFTLIGIPLSSGFRKHLREVNKLIFEHKDERIKVITEVLNGIKIIKLYAWELPFIKKISHIRNVLELGAVRDFGIYQSITVLFSTVLPFLVTFSSFATYSLFDNKSHGPLNMQLVFVSMSLFGMINTPLNDVAGFLLNYTQVMVSLGRLEKYLGADEIDSMAISHSLYDRNGANVSSEDVLVDVQNGSFKWLSTDETPLIDNVSIQCKRSELAAVIGKVGSGKSSLVSAILGDMTKAGGNVFIRGSIAYVPQQPWIINATLQDNILFGHELDPEFYDRVVEACALKPDLEMLPAGDMTEIGEKGINLSGGQKARLSLARAVYARADIYILDDPLAAVDAHVSKHLFTQVIGPSGLLASRARILVTNAVQYLPKTDSVTMLNNGSVVEQGSFNTLMANKGAVFDFVHKYIENETSDDVNDGSDTLMDVSSSSSSVSLRSDIGTARIANITRAIVTVDKDDAQSNESAALESGQLVQRELNQQVCSIRASRKNHESMLLGVLRSPMSYFDVTPMGRIINRFSADIQESDFSLPWAIASVSSNLFGIITSLTVVSITTPILLVLFIPIAFFYKHLQNLYMSSSREITRISSSTRSPIFAHFQETIGGTLSIRAYGQEKRFISDNESFLENNARATYISMFVKRWLWLRLEFLGDLILLGTAVFGVFSLQIFGYGDAGLIGLAIIYSISLNNALSSSVDSYVEAENSMTNYERIIEYTVLPSEAPEIVDDSRPAESWPQDGTVEFRNYSTRYREGLDLVLKDMSFSVQPMQKVGIVGRTGAGKSSLTLALFRIIEAAGGQIIIDGEDISKYGLFDVRSKLSIIPQDPVLFVGTVRENIDPFGNYTDEQVWSALEYAHLAEYIRSKEDGLDYKVEQGGTNFSVGQRQLICLARALLKHAKVLVLDEATAAIDNETDAIIQQSIREQFKDCTVLTIAHRLNTIIDSDMILVVDGGKVAEFDTPANLLADESSIFAQMVQESQGSGNSSS